MDNFLSTALIIEKHFKSTKSAWECIYMAMTLEPYYKNLLLLEVLCPEQVADTILHDYEGLKTKNAHFVPRLA
jgi:hypothetical protein